MTAQRLPGDCEAYRHLGPFAAATLPAGLLRAHALKPGCWGVLTVAAGRIDFVWEDALDEPVQLNAGGSIVIPPERRHHLDVTGEFSLAICLYRTPALFAAPGSAATP